MNLLVLDALDADVLQWLSLRHELRCVPALAQQPARLRESLDKIHALILPPTVAIDQRLLKAAPNLRVLGISAAGPELIDAEACRQAQIEIVRSGAATAAAESEFMIGAMLHLLRRVPVLSADGMRVGRELSGATVGLVGLTPASGLMARVLPAFGARLVGYDPSLHESDTVWSEFGIRPKALQALMAYSDVVCVQLPYFPRFHGLLGARLLSQSRPGQVLVSLSHSALFDEVALASAMGSGRILAAWFDSAEPGWLEPGRPLHGMPNLQITPRLGSTTRESRLRAAWAVAQGVDQALAAMPWPQPAAELSPAARPAPAGAAASS